MLLQEGSTVSWEDTEYFGWQEAFWCLFFIGLIYGYWRMLRWYVGRRPDCTRWRRTRYMLPTVLLPSGVVAIWAAHLVFGENGAFEVIAAVSVFLNAPALIGAGIAGLALADAGVPPWILLAAAGALSWVSWYLVIVMVEVRIESANPIRLDLSGY
jgi:hypothetical protein